MSNKLLVKRVTLEVDQDSPLKKSRIKVDLSIPVKLTEEELNRVGKIGKDGDELGVIDFSDKTSDLIREVGEAMRKELLLLKK